VLRKLSTSGEPPIREEGREKLLVEHSLPAWIFEELETAATDGVTSLTGGPTDVAALAAAFAQPAPIVARVNGRRPTREALAAELEQAGVTATPIAAAAAALRLEGLGDPSRNASFTAGRWTVQDTGAQLVAVAAGPRTGMKILDACAGVGGKSTHLAELTDD